MYRVDWEPKRLASSSMEKPFRSYSFSMRTKQDCFVSQARPPSLVLPNSSSQAISANGFINEDEARALRLPVNAAHVFNEKPFL